MDKISTLMDGELDDEEAGRQVARLRQPGMREGWDTFHVIRDALRGDPALSPDFAARLSKRLDGEPTVLAPAALRPAKRTMMYALSAAASVSAVVVVAWVALSTNPQLEGARNVATAPAVTAPVPVPQLAPVLSDGRMSEYLLAHQGVSPSTIIQGVAPYVRSVAVNSAPQPR